MDKLEELVKQINSIVIDKFVSDEEDIPENTNLKLKDDLGLDSLDLIELCMDIEGHYNIRISDDLVDNWDEMSVLEIAKQIEYLIQ